MMKHFKTYRLRQKIVTNWIHKDWYKNMYVGNRCLKLGLINSCNLINE
jgi:hypothetical protein